MAGYLVRPGSNAWPKLYADMCRLAFIVSEIDKARQTPERPKMDDLCGKYQIQRQHLTRIRKRIAAFQEKYPEFPLGTENSLGATRLESDRPTSETHSSTDANETTGLNAHCTSVGTKPSAAPAAS